MRYYRAFQTAASERYLTGPIAQRIEHPPSKRVVAGSNPARSVFLEPCMALVLRQTSPWHFSQFLDSSSHPLPFGWQQTRRINNPEVSSRIPVTSILSIFWESPPVACNRSEAAKYAALYITGMAGFSLALIWKVIRLAIRILLLVAAFAEALATGNWKTVRDRAVIVLITLAKVFSAVAGILCPPAAYKIENALDKWMPPCDQSFYILSYDPHVPTVERAYAILDLPQGSSRDEVRKQYRALLLQYHPDKGAYEGGIFDQIHGAYTRLEAHFEQDL